MNFSNQGRKNTTWIPGRANLYNEWRKQKQRNEKQKYIANVSSGRVVVKTNPYQDEHFNEMVSLPPQVAEIVDALYAEVYGSELVVRRKNGSSYAWNIKTHAPLGPR